MSDDTPKRRIRGFDVVAMIGLAVAVFGLLLSSVNSYYQFFYSRDSVLVFVRDMKVHVGRSVKANLVFVNNGTEQATILGVELQTDSEDGKGEYRGGNVRPAEYDDGHRLLPATIAPGSTKIMGVELALLPFEYDTPIFKRMVVFLHFSAASSTGRVVDSRYRLFNLVDTPEKLDVRETQDLIRPHQLFLGTPAETPGVRYGGRTH